VVVAQLGAQSASAAIVAIPGITGWTANVVRSSASITPNGFDGNQGHNMVVNGFEGAVGLPVSGAVTMTNTGDQFQLQPYGGVDSAQWSTNATSGVSNGSISLTLPAGANHYSTLAFLASSGAQSSVFTANITLNFSDATSSNFSGSLNVPDWVGAGGNAANAPVNGMNYYDSHVETGASVGLTETTISLSPADQLKQLSSITFGGGNGIDNVMAVSGTAVPEPASMAIIGIGVASLLRRRRHA
jgi:hypothetical protein